MASSSSLKALLAMVAIAGYQNRDKIGDFVKGLSDQQSETAKGGLGGLIDQLKKAGQGEVADSWVGTGENKPISEPHLEQALGDDLVESLVKQTGLSREELIARLIKTMPAAVDKMTPNGTL
jgi:uncharacterized protein YidB (DUF937 family)